MTTVVTTLEQIKAVDNLVSGNVMKDSLSIAEEIIKTNGQHQIPIFDMSLCMPNYGLQNVLIPFFKNAKLYSNPTHEQNKTALINDGKSVAATIHQEFEVKYEEFITHPIVTNIGEHNFFQSLADKETATISGEIIIGAMLNNLENITVAHITNIRELNDGESYRQAAGKLGIDKLKLIEEWRASKSSNGIDLDPKAHTGGVGKFFEKIVGFSPMSSTVRNMFERPSPVEQCNAIYRANELKIQPRTDWTDITSKAAMNIGGLGNPDGLGKRRPPLWWSKLDNNWISPVTCYICETFLYETVEGYENNMECEHLFPFLEAQLFWLLEMPTIIKCSAIIQVDDRLPTPYLLKREYAPVCRKCNGATHKTGLPILQVNKDWRGFSDYPNKIELANSSLQRIARDSPDFSPPGREHRNNHYNHILTKTLRNTRLNHVFKPLARAINTEFGNVDVRRMLEILILKYFYYFDKTTLNKVFSALLSGEDVDKKERERQIHVNYVNKYDKKFRDITLKAEQNFAYFKTFLSNKRVVFAAAAKEAARRIAATVSTAIDTVRRRRSSRTKVNVEANIAKNTTRLTHLQGHQTRMMSVLQQIKAAKDRFKTDFNEIITNPENHTFGTPGEKNDFEQRVTDINVMVNSFMGELGRKEHKEWVAAGGGIIPIAQANESDDLIKYRAYYIYHLSNHAYGVGEKYVEACEKIMNAVATNIQIDRLLTKTDAGGAYIEHWSSEKVGSTLPLSRLWCSIEQCNKAFQFLSARGGYADVTVALAKLCDLYDKNFSNLKLKQQEFHTRIYDSDVFFNGRQEKRRKKDEKVSFSRVINSVKNGKQQQLYFEQPYNMETDTEIVLTEDNKIKTEYIFIYV